MRGCLPLDVAVHLPYMAVVARTSRIEVRTTPADRKLIDRAVAAHWRENYDLRHILERDWATLGPKLVGKLHVYCGTMDNYYLNDAVYLLEEFLEGTSEPYYDGVVDYGERAEHCWNGDQQRPNALSRLRYHQMYVPRIHQRIARTAPEGADLTSWRY